MRAAMFIVLGLTLLMGVVDGIENTIDFDFVSILQLAGVSLVGFATLALGASYAEEK